MKVEPRGFTYGVDGAGMGKGSQRCAQLTGLSIWTIELAFVELEKTVEEAPLCVFSCQPPGGQRPAPFSFFRHAQRGRLDRRFGRREDVEEESENHDSCEF